MQALVYDERLHIEYPADTYIPTGVLRAYRRAWSTDVLNSSML